LLGGIRILGLNRLSEVADSTGDLSL
jgi:hypothetical protein